MDFSIEIKKIKAEIPYYTEHEFDIKISSGMGVYIYGAGFMGCKYADLLSEKGYEILGFFETSVNVAGKRVHNLPVFSVAYQNALVLISSFKYYNEMKKILIQLGYTEDKIISPMAAFDKYYIPEYEYAFHAFEDELSQKIVLDKIKYHVLRRKMIPNWVYFDLEMFSNSKEDVFVDGGAFDGATAKEFARLKNGKYKKIYCFEPTESSYAQTVQNLKDFENISVIQKGLYTHETVLQFKDFGVDEWNAVENYYMGHEWNGPEIPYSITEIEVTSLDLFFQEKQAKDYPTIIKLDIEGSEKAALLGMRNVINTSHPKLIICAYHKIEDYYELAKAIKEICPNYRLKLRHYTDSVDDSIIFAYYEEE